jgi:predicted RNA-binding Zn ribbon-like protein
MIAHDALDGLNLIGGRLCLDFVNTVSNRLTPPVQDWLATYEDLVAWGEKAGSIGESEAAALRGAAMQDPGAAQEALAAAHALRATLYDVFAALATGQSPPTAAWDALNQALAEARYHNRLVAVADGFAWRWSTGTRLDWPLWPIACSASDLLTSPDWQRIRQCAAEDCSWLFVDTSRNGRRRWCDMQECGNRAKARRYYRRRTEPAQVPG